jgi:hypothetical protein
LRQLRGVHRAALEQDLAGEAAIIARLRRGRLDDLAVGEPELDDDVAEAPPAAIPGGRGHDARRRLDRGQGGRSVAHVPSIGIPAAEMNLDRLNGRGWFRTSDLSRVKRDRGSKARSVLATCGHESPAPKQVGLAAIGCELALVVARMFGGCSEGPARCPFHADGGAR